MAHLSEEEIKRHVRIYLGVFLALAILTLVTVTVSYLRLPLLFAVLVALAIAATKSSLVAGFFMHLVWERKIIFTLLLFTAIFLLALLVLPSLGSPK